MLELVRDLKGHLVWPSRFTDKEINNSLFSIKRHLIHFKNQIVNLAPELAGFSFLTLEELSFGELKWLNGGQESRQEG